MTRRLLALAVRTTLIAACSVLTARCSAHGSSEAASGAPPPAQVDHEGDGSIVHVDHPEQFPVAAATRHDAQPQLSVTGVVSPDVSRTVPVVSLSSGRVIEVRARLGDQVHQGQLLLRIQSADISSAFSDYQKARADEALTRAQLDRASLLFDNASACCGMMLSRRR